MDLSSKGESQFAIHFNITINNATLTTEVIFCSESYVIFIFVILRNIEGFIETLTKHYCSSDKH